MRAGTARNPLATFVKSVFSLIHFHGACDGPYQPVTSHSRTASKFNQHYSHRTVPTAYTAGAPTIPVLLAAYTSGTVYVVTQMPRPSSSLLPDTI